MSPRYPRDRYGRPLPPGSRDQLEHHGISASAEEAYRRGVTLFDAGRFFEAHECFEQVWKSDVVEEQDRGFWKGVTQVAVGCCHVQRGNDMGARAVLDRAAGHLRGYSSPHRGVDTDALVALARDIAERVRRHGASAVRDFPQFPRSG